MENLAPVAHLVWLQVLAQDSLVEVDPGWALEEQLEMQVLLVVARAEQVVAQAEVVVAQVEFAGSGLEQGQLQEVDVPRVGKVQSSQIGILEGSQVL
jgi:hypothetical protein